MVDCGQTFFAQELPIPVFFARKLPRFSCTQKKRFPLCGAYTNKYGKVSCYIKLVHFRLELGKLREF